MEELRRSASDNLDQRIEQSLGQIASFSQKFATMLQEPVSHSSMRSETEKLSESVDHSARFRKLYTDYNHCAYQNIRLKDANARLSQQNRTLQVQLDILQQKQKQPR